MFRVCMKRYANGDEHVDLCGAVGHGMEAVRSACTRMFLTGWWPAVFILKDIEGEVCPEVFNRIGICKAAGR